MQASFGACPTSWIQGADYLSRHRFYFHPFIKGPFMRCRPSARLVAISSLTACAWTFSPFLRAQPYWTEDLGGAGNDLTADVKTDAAGDIYITGEFSGNVQFLGQSLVSAGGLDLFVAKLHADGTLAWAVRGGGAGIDRGVKIAVGTNGTVAVAGLFSGSATFFGTPLTSAGGTPDMMAAVLNAATGAPVWVAQGGGPTGMDRPYGISMASDGSVAVAGEFIGTAQWGAQSLTSTPDGTSAPTTDVFIVDYSAAGAVNWVQQGASSADDRAIDVAHDATGNIYVTGQFGSAITFDEPHANGLENATFLVKLDASGNELWFRRCGGATFNYVRDMLVAPNGQVVLAGDVQGNMIFFDSNNATVSSSAAFAYYLLKVDATGQLVGSSTLGSGSSVHVAGIDLRNDTISAIGSFNCRFSGLGDHYNGQGLFVAVGDEDLFVARHRFSNLGLTDGQQFGGREGKTAGQIASLPDGSLIFCGSFEYDLFFPSNPVPFSADLSSFELTGQQVNAPHCGDPWAGSYVGDVSSGVNDGFVARGYVKGRTPYDFWNRADDDCLFGMGDLCISLQFGFSCLDSITNCGPLGLRVRPNYSWSSLPNSHYLGPPFSVHWSNGSTNQVVSANVTGWLHVDLTPANGCFTLHDSIYVNILPLPQLPLISDDVPVNTNASNPQRIDLCEPDSVWIWGNTVPGLTHYWIALNTNDTTYSDSLHVGESGGYSFCLENAQGCVHSNTVLVNIAPVIPMPDLGLQLTLSFPQDTSSSDSLNLCSSALLELMDSTFWSVDGVPADFPEGLVLMTRVEPNGWGYPPDPGPQLVHQSVDSSGWQVIHFDALVTNAPCGVDTLFFGVVDSIFVNVYPPVPVSVSITGPSLMCPDDSLLLQATCVACDSITWAGPFILEEDGNDILVGGGGDYQAIAMATDSHGCYYSDIGIHNVVALQAPVLELDPTDGILCPGGTAQITSSQTGTAYAWYGPGGLLDEDGPSITTDVPGEYYMVMSTSLGCDFVSDQVQLTTYATPYLNVAPVPILCAGQGPVTLQVVTAAVGGVQWSAPLAGGALTQTVSSPGTYHCAVTSCGIVTQLSVTITAGGASAELLTPGPLTICPDQPVTIQAVPGQPNYTWSPGGSTGSSLTTDIPGEYSVVADDGAGCTDTSAVVIVQSFDYTEPLSGGDISICWGQDTTMVVSGSGAITWYPGPNFNVPAGTGDSLLVIQAPDTVIYHVIQQEGVCTSDPIIVVLNVTPIESPIGLTGPEHLCGGDALTITMQGDPELEVNWTTPTGPASGNPLVIDPVTAANGGDYTVHPSLGECLVVPQTLTVPIDDPMLLPWQPDTTFCTGGALTLTIPLDYSNPAWSTGSTQYQLQIIDPGTYALAVTDPNGCPVAMVIDVGEELCDLVIPNVFTPNGDGINDAWLVQGGFTSADLHLYNRWGKLLFSGNLFKRLFRGLDDGGNALTDGVYYYVLDLGMTKGRSKQVSGYLHIQR
jgi:gliding motility-associated-like protein